ncbi:hypothetical protein BJ741DRAFT_698200 [Chytriomyces cf. hyalinus JEL632]|nr:hypothetical protein BJ741DRAFT_698200 [Chytriomyces cf. hyalinus JEL632]
MNESGNDDGSSPQTRSLVTSPDISNDSYLDKSPLTTCSEPENPATSRQSLVRRMSLQLERKLCADVPIGGRISEVENWPSLADRPSITQMNKTDDPSKFPSNYSSEPTPNTNTKASRLSGLQIGTPNFKKSLKALFGPESAFSDQLQHPVPSPSPSIRRSAVSAGKKIFNSTTSFGTTYRQADILTLRQSCTREDVQVVLFTAADMLTASAATANRKVQADASSKATTEAFTSYRLFELAERVSNGLPIEAESDFEVVAGFLRLLGVVPNFLEEDCSKYSLSRDASKSSPCASPYSCGQNSFGPNQSLALLSKDLMNGAVEADNVMAMTVAKSETSYSALADVEEISISARYQEAVYSAPKSPKEGWLSIKEDSEDWVDVFVSVNSREVKMLLSSLDATTYVVPVKACSASFQKIPASSCSLYTFVITVTDEREYVLGSSNLKDLQDWVGRITNYSKDEDIESLPTSHKNAAIHIHISDGNNRDINITKPPNLSIHEIKQEALSRYGLIEFIDRYDLVMLDSDDDSETRRPEFQNIPLDRLLGDGLTNSTLEQPLRFALSRKELISWTISVDVPDRKVSRKVLVNACTTIADVKDVIAIMEDFCADTLHTYSLMYNNDVMNPGATLDPWNSSASFSFTKTAATVDVTACNMDSIPGIVLNSGAPANESSSRLAVDQRTSSKSILTAADLSGDSVLQTIPVGMENCDIRASKKPGWNFKSIFNKYGKAPSSNSPGGASASTQQDDSDMDAVLWKGVVKSKKSKTRETAEDAITNGKNAVHDAESVVWKGAVKSKAQISSQSPVNTPLDDLDSVVWKGAVKSKQKGGNLS